jgi:hypothetical protein
MTLGSTRILCGRPAVGPEFLKKVVHACHQDRLQ